MKLASATDEANAPFNACSPQVLRTAGMQMPAAAISQATALSKD